MSNAGRILSVTPGYAIAGGEVEIACEGFSALPDEHGCYIGGEECRIVGASSSRVLTTVPEGVEGTVNVVLVSGEDETEPAPITVGRKLASELHIVANPAIDPKDDSIFVTRSGSRGQHFEHTLYRIDKDGFVNELSADLMNPTGLAFDQRGDLYVTNRAEGLVCRVDNGEDVAVYASDMGVATGIAFDSEGLMFVGDRSGTIYHVREFGRVGEFTTLEPSVAAFHMAFGPDGRLFVTSPGLASHDGIYAIEKDGTVSTYFRGFGRPQGLAFDTDGNLYIAACYRGRHGIVRIDAAGQSAETVLSGNSIVGLCFTRAGEMIVATGEEVYSVPIGVQGTLLS